MQFSSFLFLLNNFYTLTFTLVFIANFFILEVKAYEITFVHTSVFANVTTLSFNDTSCANLPPQFVNHVRSFKFTQRLCVQFHDQPDCNGDSFQTTARGFTTSLLTWNFHNRTNSVRLCPDPCVPSYGQSIPIVANETNTSFPIIPISMFSAPDFKGRKLSITVQSCTHLDKNLGLVGLPISIRIPKTQCVLLFYTSVTQQTGDDRDCIVDDVGYSVLELQGSRPGLEYIPNWFGVIPAPYIKAISPCQCLSRMSYPKSTVSVDFPPVENLITLFSSPNFRGQNVTILLNFTNCLTLTNDEFRDWEGTAESIYVGNKSCVSVYTEHDCPSHLETRIRNSIPYLFHYNLDQRIRSLRPCILEESIVKNKSESTLLYFLITVSCISTTIALGLIAIQMYIRKRYRTMYRTMKERLSEKEVKEFMEGLCLQLETVQDQDGQHFAIEDNGIGPVASKLSSDLLAQNQPYDNRLEIPVDRLEYGGNCPIGSGEFAVVFKGSLKQHDDRNVQPVAIKTAKPHSNAQGLRALLKEIKIMMFVGNHRQIVSLIGCSTVNLREGELLIVLEYCGNGSLERFLKSNRSNFVNLVQKGKIQDDPISNEALQRHEQPNYTTIIPGSELPKMLNIHQLLAWSIEIAEGMDYLTSKRVIHGDLAARNVLLTENLTAKISDFGLSRKMYCYTHYTKQGEDPLPWRWLALESLKTLQFSTASDVWSYGILLWEIFTLGEQPYPGVSSLTNNFIINLDEGLRPSLPPFATSDVYNVMSSCWDYDAKLRPAFRNLISSLRNIHHACRS